MSAKKSVEIFYDVLSPYSWIGFEGICRYQQRWNINLHMKPMLLGFVMAASENVPPGINPTRARYLAKDLHRNSAYHQVPLSQPKDFMGTIIQKGSLSAQRLLTAASLSRPDKLEDLSRALWLRIWSKDLDITETGSLLEACKSIGLTDTEAESLVGDIKDQKVKDALKKTTEEAVAHGAFGAPTFVVECVDGKKRMVFGSDRFYLMAEMLGEKYEGPLRELSKI